MLAQGRGEVAAGVVGEGAGEAGQVEVRRQLDAQREGLGELAAGEPGVQEDGPEEHVRVVVRRQLAGGAQRPQLVEGVVDQARADQLGAAHQHRVQRPGLPPE